MKRALVVDDNAQVRALVSASLRAGGWEVVEAPEAASATSAAAQAPVHLLVTDVTLGGSSGFRLALEVRERWPGAAVLYVSGHDMAMLARVASEDQVPLPLPGPDVAFLLKPFGVADLRAATVRLFSVGEATPDH